MIVNLKQLTQMMFRKISQRENMGLVFKPYFYRFIGLEDENYNDILRTLKEKMDEHADKCVIFDNTIPINGEMELIEYIYNELNTMDITNMQSQDIVLFEDAKANLIFLKALDYVIPLAIQNESFFNDNVRNNFITKLIVWTYSFIRNLNITSDMNPKCIYYGAIGRHEVYFLILLYVMGFDVIFINPLKEEHFKAIDKDNLSVLCESMSICEIDSFFTRASKGKVIENIETITKQIERDVHEQLFSNTGIYKPWQFRDGYTRTVLLDTILEDIYIYWNEMAKLREGFSVSQNIVKVPCFFKKIDGEYLDKMKYQKLVKHCVNSANTLFFNDGNISKDYIETDDMYQLMFCQLSDGTFDINEVKKLSIYRFSKYSPEIQDFILNKVNETILNKDIFVNEFKKEDILKLFVLVLSLNENIVRMIDNFDFTSNVPKIVIYLNNEDNIKDSMVMLLAYLHVIGFDIVIFNPSGLFNINNILKKETINVIRLENMNYSSNYRSLDNIKQSVLARILKK